MKTFLITENQLKSLIKYIINEQYQSKEETLKQFYKEKEMEDWFVKNIVDNIEEKISPKYPYSIFYVDKNDGYYYMKQNKKYKELLIDYDRLWSYFEINYIDDNKEIQELIKHLVDVHMNLFGLTPKLYYGLGYELMGELGKLGKYNI